jgi:cytochrome b
MATVNTVKVWDLPVRIFHWSLVACFAIAYVTGDDLETLHAWFGYAIAALILFRLVYGFVGSKYARFSDFVYSPENVVTYLKSLSSGSPRHYLGHNPAGGWMVMVLLVSLALSTWSGLKAYADEGHGPLAAATDIALISTAYADSDEDDEHDGKSGEEDEFWKEVHEFFVNFTLIMVFVHIAGVFVSGRLHQENLVKAMITGEKSGE